ncbi:hypothetical protein PVK06_026712 [Gossypium arboreum]|uniref:Uncharacterized protein n=1 Tax=Gossypium arboreum TaxID=29729 RepID=A0ABR0NYG9_GOSAR|nr:hypothetical protein PVK06_026712 [Gossypium arboreum]
MGETRIGMSKGPRIVQSYDCGRVHDRACSEERQIDKWKGKKDFKVLHLDDYDYVLDLNFLKKVNALLVPFEDCISILDTRQQQCVMSVIQDLRGGTKVLSAIQLAEDIHCGKNIDSVDLKATKTPLEKLEV